VTRSAKANHYIAPIDGLRAIAVIAVLLYHLGVKQIPGGFLGVDLFFAISGYVITRLILDSIETANALDLRQFYFARVRRLLPALLFVLGITLVAVALFAPDAIHRVISDLPYVLTGSNNWHLVALHQDYFQSAGRPPLLQHTWSLSVETQFYLVWPIALYLIWRKFGKANIARIALAIAFSSALALFIFSLQADSASVGRISHIYFGTDTHSLGLFLGSALAVSWVPRNLTANISQRAQDFIDGIGLFGFFGLLCTFLFISESNPTAYKLAFPLAALFSCASITSLVHPASRFAPVLSWRPLLWIGQRSYGIYLWHWIVFQMTRPSVDLAAGSAFALDIARILLVLALSDISLRYIEVPFRRGKIQNWFRGMKYRTPIIRKRQQVFVSAVLGVIIVMTGGATATAYYRDAHAPKIKKSELNLVEKSVTKEGIWLTGDSIILGARYKLEQQYPLALVNARVGRQIEELIAAVTADQSQVTKNTVVMDVGNNNRITRESLIMLLDLVKNQPHVILLNTSVPRGWKDANNALINEVVPQYPNMTLIDWANISNNHPEFFAPDGVHLNDNGSDVYVAAIIEALQSVGVTA
jgi:peptidoglycan/LPS O-acetylase OafA/YrhL